MKKIIVFILLILCLTACASTQNIQRTTLFMNSDSKIQYYQEQIDHYNFLIKQEEKKIEAVK